MSQIAFPPSRKPDELPEAQGHLHSRLSDGKPIPYHNQPEVFHSSAEQRGNLSRRGRVKISITAARLGKCESRRPNFLAHHLAAMRLKPKLRNKLIRMIGDLTPQQMRDVYPNNQDVSSVVASLYNRIGNQDYDKYISSATSARRDARNKRQRLIGRSRQASRDEKEFFQGISFENTDSIYQTSGILTTIYGKILDLFKRGKDFLDDTISFLASNFEKYITTPIKTFFDYVLSFIPNLKSIFEGWALEVTKIGAAIGFAMLAFAAKMPIVRAVCIVGCLVCLGSIKGFRAAALDLVKRLLSYFLDLVFPSDDDESNFQAGKGFAESFISACKGFNDIHRAQTNLASTIRLVYDYIFEVVKGYPPSEARNKFVYDSMSEWCDKYAPYIYKPVTEITFDDAKTCLLLQKEGQAIFRDIQNRKLSGTCIAPFNKMLENANNTLPTWRSIVTGGATRPSPLGIMFIGGSRTGKDTSVTAIVKELMKDEEVKKLDKWKSGNTSDVVFYRRATADKHPGDGMRGQPVFHGVDMYATSDSALMADEMIITRNLIENNPTPMVCSSLEDKQNTFALFDLVFITTNLMKPVHGDMVDLTNMQAVYNRYLVFRVITPEVDLRQGEILFHSYVYDGDASYVSNMNYPLDITKEPDARHLKEAITLGTIYDMVRTRLLKPPPVDDVYSFKKATVIPRFRPLPYYPARLMDKYMFSAIPPPGKRTPFQAQVVLDENPDLVVPPAPDVPILVQEANATNGTSVPEIQEAPSSSEEEDDFQGQKQSSLSDLKRCVWYDNQIYSIDGHEDFVTFGALLCHNERGRIYQVHFADGPVFVLETACELDLCYSRPTRWINVCPGVDLPASCESEMLFTYYSKEGYIPTSHMPSCPCHMCGTPPACTIPIMRSSKFWDSCVGPTRLPGTRIIPPLLEDKERTAIPILTGSGDVLPTIYDAVQTFLMTEPRVTILCDDSEEEHYQGFFGSGIVTRFFSRFTTPKEWEFAFVDLTREEIANFYRDSKGSLSDLLDLARSKYVVGVTIHEDTKRLQITKGFEWDFVHFELSIPDLLAFLAAGALVYAVFEIALSYLSPDYQSDTGPKIRQPNPVPATGVVRYQSGGGEFFSSNFVKIMLRQEKVSPSQWAIAVDDTTILTTAHILRRDGHPLNNPVPVLGVTVYKGGKSFAYEPSEVKIQGLCAKDIALFKLSRPIPGLKSIIHRFVSEGFTKELPVKFVYDGTEHVYDRRGVVEIHDCHFYQHVQSHGSEELRYTCDAVTEDGDCGRIYVTKVDGNFRVMGLHRGIRKQHEKLIVPITAQEIMQMLLDLNPPSQLSEALQASQAFEIVGQVDAINGAHLPNKHNITPTVYQSRFPNFPPSTRPAALKPQDTKDGISPIALAISTYNPSPAEMPSQFEIDCVEGIIRKLLPPCIETQPTDMWLFQHKRPTMNASTGWPLNTGQFNLHQKKQAIHIVEDKHGTILDLVYQPAAASELHDLCAALQDKTFDATKYLATLTLKIETLPHEKVDAGKTRTFNVCPLAVYLATSVVCAPILQPMFDNGTDSFSTFGINVHGPEWEETLAPLFTEDGGFLLDADYRKLDRNHLSSQKRQDFSIIEDVVTQAWNGNNRFTFNKRTYTFDLSYVIPILLKLGTIPHFLLNRLVLRLTRYILVSGGCWTAFLNALENLRMIIYTYIEARKLASLPTFSVDVVVEEFTHHLIPKTHGDDLLLKTYLNTFTLKLFAKVCAKYGHTVTPAQKGAELTDFVDPYKSTFLKRRFVLVPDEKTNCFYVMAQRTEADIIEALYWKDSKTDFSVWLVSTMRSMLDDFSHHPRRVYDFWWAEFEAILKERKLSFNPPILPYGMKLIERGLRPYVLPQNWARHLVAPDELSHSLLPH